MGQEICQDTSGEITLLWTKSLGVPRNLRRHGMPIAPFVQGSGQMTCLHFRNGVLDAWLVCTLRGC